MKYNKPAIDINQQIALLRKRGLIIADEPAAKFFLHNISYYRLAGYWWPMQADKMNHRFKPNSTFENIFAIYNFDRELRILVFDAIERIEIAFRTKLIYQLSHEISPWWFEDRVTFCLRLRRRMPLHSRWALWTTRIYQAGCKALPRYATYVHIMGDCGTKTCREDPNYCQNHRIHGWVRFHRWTSITGYMYTCAVWNIC